MAIAFATYFKYRFQNINCNYIYTDPKVFPGIDSTIDKANIPLNLTANLVCKDGHSCGVFLEVGMVERLVD